MSVYGFLSGACVSLCGSQCVCKSLTTFIVGKSVCLELFYTSTSKLCYVYLGLSVCLCMLPIFLYLYHVYLCALVCVPMSYVVNTHVYSMCLCQWTFWNTTVWRVYLGSIACVCLWACLCVYVSDGWVYVNQTIFERYVRAWVFNVATEGLKNFSVVQQCSSTLFSVAIKHPPGSTLFRTWLWNRLTWVLLKPSWWYHPIATKF